MVNCVGVRFGEIMCAKLSIVLSFAYLFLVQGCSIKSPNHYCFDKPITKIVTARLVLSDEGLKRANEYDWTFLESPIFLSKAKAILGGFDVSLCFSEDFCLLNKKIKVGVREVCEERSFSQMGGSICNDGSYSSSTGRGSCSHHGGIRQKI